MDIPVVSIQETIELKANRPGSDHAPGLVILFDGRQCEFKLPLAGSTINLIRPDGTQLAAELGEVKSHGDGRSFFLPGLNKDDVPVGSIASWTVSVTRSVSSARQPTRV